MPLLFQNPLWYVYAAPVLSVPACLTAFLDVHWTLLPLWPLQKQELWSISAPFGLLRYVILFSFGVLFWLVLASPFRPYVRLILLCRFLPWISNLSTIYLCISSKIAINLFNLQLLSKIVILFVTAHGRRINSLLRYVYC